MEFRRFVAVNCLDVKKLFIATYDNTTSTSEKIESKHWTKFHAAIHSYIRTESYTSSLKGLSKINPSIVQKHACGMILQDIRKQVGLGLVAGKLQSIEESNQLELKSVATRSIFSDFSRYVGRWCITKVRARY